MRHTLCGERTLRTLQSLPSQAQNGLAQQIIRHWQPFKDLKQTFAVSRRAEQLCVGTQQRIVATVEDSVLRTEMGDLQSQEEDAPKSVLWYKPKAWLGVISPHRRDETWSASLWQTFFAMCVGAQIAAIAVLPPSACGCKKFALDALGDDVSTCNTCTTHSGAKKAYDWAVEQLRGRCPWCCTYASHMSVGEVALTLVLIGNCITQLT